jgi:DNA-binding transcriptional MerR regulator
MVYKYTYPGKAIRQSATRIVRSAVANDWSGALEGGYDHLAFVRAERAQAETAATLLERWAANRAADVTDQSLQIGEVAALLGVSIDMLRNWERNGLINVPRDARNHYRRYGAPEISRLRIIRLLSRVGYSQMAILRMLLQLDSGLTTDLRHSLDTPRPDDDVYSATDRWLSTLAEQEQVAQRLIALIEDIIGSHADRRPSSTR